PESANLRTDSAIRVLVRVGVELPVVSLRGHVGRLGLDGGRRAVHSSAIAGCGWVSAWKVAVRLVSGASASQDWVWPCRTCPGWARKRHGRTSARTWWVRIVAWNLVGTTAWSTIAPRFLSSLVLATSARETAS